MACESHSSAIMALDERLSSVTAFTLLVSQSALRQISHASF